MKTKTLHEILSTIYALLERVGDEGDEWTLPVTLVLDMKAFLDQRPAHYEAVRQIEDEIEALRDDRVRLAMWTGDGLPKGWDAGEVSSGPGTCQCCPDLKDGTAVRGYGTFVNPAAPAQTDSRGKPLGSTLQGLVLPEGGWRLKHDSSIPYGAATVIATGEGRVFDAFKACDDAAATYIETLAKGGT